MSKTRFRKIIYALWDQGPDAAPELARLNFARWATLNPDYEMVVLDQRGMDQLFAEVQFDPPPGLRIQALSDVARTHLLWRTGGVWVDASLFPTQPLDLWLPERLENGGFFAFERPAPDRPLSNWFLAAHAGSAVVERWKDALRRYWVRGRELAEGAGIPDDPVGEVAPPASDFKDTYPYFCHHYLFRYLLEREPEFAALWRRCAPLTAADAIALQLAYEGETPKQERLRQILLGAPVHKLDWRRSYPLDVIVETADALLTQTRAQTRETGAHERGAHERGAREIEAAREWTAQSLWRRLARWSQRPRDAERRPR